MGALGAVVLEETRLVELADHLGQCQRGFGLGQRVAAGREIALRQMRHGQARGVGQVEHQVEVGGARREAEVDGTDLADLDAAALVVAARGIDIGGHTVAHDGVGAASGETGAATGADRRIDRVARRPANLELAQPAFDADLACAMHRHPARAGGRQGLLVIGKHGDLQLAVGLAMQALRPIHGERAVADNGEPAGAGVGD